MERINFEGSMIQQTYLDNEVPKLDHRQEFEETLANYQPSPEAIEALKETRVVALNGPSSTGRNTVIRELLKTDDYYFIVSDTTRPRRYNDGILEQDGREYYFRKEDDLLNDLKQGRFIEAEIIHNQQVSGVSIREVEKAHELNKTAIADMEIEGVVNLSNLKPDAIVVIFVPPSFEEWVNRINNRGKLGDAELHNRFQTATKIFKLSLSKENFHFVVNDEIGPTVDYVNSLVKSGNKNPEAETKARQLAEQLHIEIADYLKIHAPYIKPY